MPPKTASPRRAAGRSSSPTRGRFARSRTPLRLQLIGLLRTEGPLTATQAGQRLDSRGAERAQARAARAHRPLPRPSAEPGAAAADRRPLNACPLWLRRVPTHPRGRAAPGTPTTHNTPRDPSPIRQRRRGGGALPRQSVPTWPRWVWMRRPQGARPGSCRSRCRQTAPRGPRRQPWPGPPRQSAMQTEVGGVHRVVAERAQPPWSVRARDKCQQGASRRVAKRELPLAHGLRREAHRFDDVLTLEVREIREDIIHRHPRGRTRALVPRSRSATLYASWNSGGPTPAGSGNPGPEGTRGQGPWVSGDPGSGTRVSGLTRGIGGNPGLEAEQGPGRTLRTGHTVVKHWTRR